MFIKIDINKLQVMEENEMKKQKIQNIFNLVLGILYILTTILGYYKNISYMSEYCFVSGIIIGLIFIFSFIHYINKKEFLPVWIYANCVVAAVIIFIATIVLKLRLEGAFWFIHIINPILLFTYWLLFCNHNEIKNQLIITTNLVFPLCYVVFAEVVFIITNKCPFPAELILVGNSWYVIIAYLFGIGIILLMLGYSLHFTNRFIKRLKK